MTPKNSHAIVVAIEKYQFQGLTLPGPVAEALEVVEWLELAGMPRDHIHLFVSAADSHTVIPADAFEATYIEFEKFRGKLANLSGDVLYIFWGGHGFLSREQDRILFWSDTSEKTLDHHLNFDGFMNHLRGTSFPVQIGLVDACAEAWDRKRQIFDLGHSRWSASLDPGRSSAKQSFLFAAAEGKITSNAPGRRLTPIFLKELKAEYDSVPVWPPDPDRIFEGVCKHLTGDKRPVLYQYRSLTGDFRECIGRIGKEISLSRVRAIAEELKLSQRFLRDFLVKAKGREFCTQEDLLSELHKAASSKSLDQWITAAGEYGPELRMWLECLFLLSRADDLLNQLCAEPDYQHLYAQTLGYLRLKNLDVTLGRREILAELFDIGNNPDGDGKFALWLFLSRVVRQTNSEALKQFLQEKADSATLTRINLILDKESTEARRQNRHFLLIYFDAKPSDPSLPSRVHAWLQSTVCAGPWSEPADSWSDAKAQIAAIIREARRALRSSKLDPSEMWVEFALSARFFDQDYATIEVRLNEDDVRELWRLHPIFFRWSTRVLGLDDVDDKDWKTACAAIKGALSLSSKWFELAHSADGCCSGSAFISLGFIPDSETTRSKRWDLVRFGAPLLRWKRIGPADSEDERHMLDQIIERTSGATLDVLLSELSRRHAEAVFWDDAERTFDPQQFQLTEMRSIP